MTRSIILACLLAITALGATQAQTARPPSELVSALALPADTKLNFFDTNGSAISYREFMQKAKDDKLSFSIDKDMDAHTATLRLGSAKKPAKPSQPTLKIHLGQALPTFALDTAQGRHLTDAALTGHYTLLSFYFADCLPCIAEVPALNALAQRHDGLEVLPVTYEPGETARAFARQRKLQLDSLIGAQAWIDAIGVDAYPTLILVDPQGHMAAAAISTSLAKHGSPTADDIGRWVGRNRVH